MQYLLTICLTGYTMIACAQKYPAELVENRVTVNYADHYITFFVHPVKTAVFPASQKKYYWYSANDVRSTQGGFSGKLLNGPYSNFYNNKQLKEQGSFVSGLKAGNWRSWTDSGILKEDTRWKKGVLNGRSYQYNNSGRLIERANYRQGMLGGKRIFYETGDSTKVINYKNGKEHTPKPIIPAFLSRFFKNKNERISNPDQSRRNER